MVELWEAQRVLSQEIPRENDVRDGSGVEVPFLPSFPAHLFQSRHGWSQEATALLHFGNYSLGGHGADESKWPLSKGHLSSNKCFTANPKLLQSHIGGCLVSWCQAHSVRIKTQDFLSLHYLQSSLTPDLAGI